MFALRGSRPATDLPGCRFATLFRHLHHAPRCEVLGERAGRGKRDRRLLLTSSRLQKPSRTVINDRKVSASPEFAWVASERGEPLVQARSYRCRSGCRLLTSSKPQIVLPFAGRPHTLVSGEHGTFCHIGKSRRTWLASPGMSVRRREHAPSCTGGGDPLPAQSPGTTSLGRLRNVPLLAFARLHLRSTKAR